MTRASKLKRLEESLEFLVKDSADIYILFVDLCDSTEYKRNNPEWVWVTRQLLFLRRVANIITNYGGIVVKTIGDEVMGIFQVRSNPEDVLKCAIEIVQGSKRFKVFMGKEIIRVRASIDFGLTYNGSIITKGNYDPIGTPVDRCARLNSRANRNEILFSQDFLSTLLVNFTEEQLIEKYGFTRREEDLQGIGIIDAFSILIH